MAKAQRIDPSHCGCTDCLTGYSVPLSDATEKDLKRLYAGKVINATGFVARKTVRFDLTWDSVTDESAGHSIVKSSLLNYN